MSDWEDLQCLLRHYCVLFPYIEPTLQGYPPDSKQLNEAVLTDNKQNLPYIEPTLWGYPQDSKWLNDAVLTDIRQNLQLNAVFWS